MVGEALNCIKEVLDNRAKLCRFQNKEVRESSVLSQTSETSPHVPHERPKFQGIIVVLDHEIGSVQVLFKDRNDLAIKIGMNKSFLKNLQY